MLRPACTPLLEARRHAAGYKVQRDAILILLFAKIDGHAAGVVYRNKLPHVGALCEGRASAPWQGYLEESLR